MGMAMSGGGVGGGGSEGMAGIGADGSGGIGADGSGGIGADGSGGIGDITFRAGERGRVRAGSSGMGATSGVLRRGGALRRQT